MSSVLKKNLPRPPSVPVVDEFGSEAERMIYQTMRVIIENDNFNHPFTAAEAKQPQTDLPEVTVERLEEAKRAIEDHLQKSGFDPDVFDREVVENPGIFDTEPELAKIARLEAEINSNQKPFEDT
jgi:hypothetical protein